MYPFLNELTLLIRGAALLRHLFNDKIKTIYQEASEMKKNRLENVSSQIAHQTQFYNMDAESQ